MLDAQPAMMATTMRTTEDEFPEFAAVTHARALAETPGPPAWATLKVKTGHAPKPKVDRAYVPPPLPSMAAYRFARHQELWKRSESDRLGYERLRRKRMEADAADRKQTLYWGKVSLGRAQAAPRDFWRKGPYKARPGHPREFLFSDDAEPQPRQVFNQWPGLRPRAEEVAAQAAQEDDGEHPPGWREAWRALGPPAVLAAETLAGPAHDPRLAMRPSSFNTGVEPSPAPPTATSTAALLEENVRMSTGQATSLSSLRAAQAPNPAALPGGRDYVAPPGTNRHMIRAQLDHARALDFENSTLGELSEAVATLEEIRDIAMQVLGSAHPDTVNMENLLQEAQGALAARQAPPPPPGSA